jgi:hypothetical protein
MPFRDDDDWDDLDDPDEPDDEDDETVPCPYCREPVYEDAERCPGCGHYLSREDAPWRRPWWLVAGVVVCLLVILMWVVR